VGTSPVGSRRSTTRQAGISEHVDALEELIRVVNEAQERDAQDESRLYNPLLGEQPSFFQRRRAE